MIHCLSLNPATRQGRATRTQSGFFRADLPAGNTPRGSDICQYCRVFDMRRELVIVSCHNSLMTFLKFVHTEGAFGVIGPFTPKTEQSMSKFPCSLT